MIRNTLVLLLLMCGAGKVCCQQSLQLEPALYILSDDSVKFQGKKIGIDFLANELIDYDFEIPEQRKKDVLIRMFVLPKVSLNTVTQVKLTLKTSTLLKVTYQITPGERTVSK